MAASTIAFALVAALTITSASAWRFGGPKARKNAAGAGTAVDALFIFGDSFWDIGNNKYAYATHNEVIPLNILPYGVDYLPMSGRCSNGRVVSDFLGTCHAKKLTQWLL